MGAFALLALFGVGMIALLSGDDDAPVEEPPVEEPSIDEPPVEEPPVEFDDSNGTIFINGELAFPVGDPADLPDGVTPNFLGLQTGAGDDSIILEDTNGSYIFSGEGNDTVTSSTGQYSTIQTQGGDDHIISGAADSISAGDGNDTLDANFSDTAQLPFVNGPTVLSGEAGNDQFNIAIDIDFDTVGFDDPDNALVLTGEGEDTVSLVLNLVDDGLPSDETTTSDAIISLGDFDRAEDVLTIQIDHEPYGVERTIASTEITTETVNTDNGPSELSTLTLTFAATDTLAEHIATIRLGETPNLTAEDIVFVSG